MKKTACEFEIVVCYPENTKELERRVAQVHANAVLDKVKKLDWTVQQKKALIHAICKSVAS